MSADITAQQDGITWLWALKWHGLKHTNAGRVDVDAVSLTAAHNLGVSSHNLDVGFARSIGHSQHNAPDFFDLKAFFQDE